MTVLEKHLYKLKHLENIVAFDVHEVSRQNALKGIEREKKIIENLQNPDQEIWYGVWSTVSKKFCFGIRAGSKTKAREALVKKIGSDAMKWRWVVKVM